MLGEYNGAPDYDLLPGSLQASVKKYAKKGLIICNFPDPKSELGDFVAGWRKLRSLRSLEVWIKVHRLELVFLQHKGRPSDGGFTGIVPIKFEGTLTGVPLPLRVLSFWKCHWLR